MQFKCTFVTCKGLHVLRRLCYNKYANNVCLRKRTVNFRHCSKSTLLLNFFIFGFSGRFFCRFSAFLIKSGRTDSNESLLCAGIGKRKNAPRRGKTFRKFCTEKFFLLFGNAGALRNCAIEKKTVDGKRRILSVFRGIGAKNRKKIDFHATQYVVFA